MFPFRKFKYLACRRDTNRVHNEEEEIRAPPKPEPGLELQLERAQEEETTQDGEPAVSPIGNDTKPIPGFVDTWNDWDEGNDDGGMQDEYMQHCIVHCSHRICQVIAATPKDTKATECKCRINSKGKDSSTSAAAIFPKDKIEKITRIDVERARQMYTSLDRTKLVIVELQSALAILEKLESMEILDVRLSLISSPYFTPSTLFNGEDYRSAVEDANSIIKQFQAYFDTSLSFRPGNTRSISIKELKQEMWNFMRVEVLWWMCRWWLPASIDINNRFMTVLTVVNSKRHHEGVKVLLERMEQMVRDVVSVQVWWYGEQRTIGDEYSSSASASRRTS